MIKLWRLLSVSIVLAVCLGLMLVPGAPPQVALAAANSGMEVVPNVTTVGFTEDFDLEIWARVPANQSWDTADVHLNFSPTYMQVNSIVNGALPIVLGSIWNNVTGTVDFTSGILGSVNGSLLVCTINCTSKGTTGISTIDFVFISPLRETEIIYFGDRLLDWARVVNGTVKVGGPPTISSVSPDNLAFNAIEGGENPPAQTLEVCSSGTSMLSWSLTDNTGWLSETPTSGSLAEDECEDVTVSVDVAGMAAGDYSATITTTGSAGVAVNLHIESAAPPVEPANLSVSSVSISPPQVKPGEEVTISVNVTNTGGETGSYNAVLYINGAVEDSQSVSVDPGMTKNVIFTVSKSDTGVYDVLIAEQSGQFEVVSTGWFGGGLGTGGIVVIVVIVIALIVALVFVLRRTRRAV